MIILQDGTELRSPDEIRDWVAKPLEDLAAWCAAHGLGTAAHAEFAVDLSQMHGVRRRAQSAASG